MFMMNGRKLAAPLSEDKIERYFQLLGLKVMPVDITLDMWGDNVERDVKNLTGDTKKVSMVAGKEISKNEILEVFAVPQNHTADMLSMTSFYEKENSRRVQKYAEIMACGLEISDWHTIFPGLGVKLDMLEYIIKKSNGEDVEHPDDVERKGQDAWLLKMRGDVIETHTPEKKEPEPTHPLYGNFPYKDIVKCPKRVPEDFEDVLRRLALVLQALSEEEATADIVSEHNRWELNPTFYRGADSFMVEDEERCYFLWVHHNLDSDDAEAMTFDLFDTHQNARAVEYFKKAFEEYEAEMEKRAED
ncbi:hypothetical protein [uncultured Selenomonas sp.]|jgi:hypothetical protein|uniref:hypothetical protein n=1 Tax=uncultured Selenomonas sp. TaxID=159275 RepID=UPI0028E29961|nr:hypothetical protein [uncultured Selenomonas sp.]